MHFWEEVKYCPDEHAQGSHFPPGPRGQFASHLPLKLLADDGIHQLIFVFKVGIKGGSIERRPLGDVLDGNRRKTLFLGELLQSLLQELMGPLDAGVNTFHLCHHRILS